MTLVAALAACGPDNNAASDAQCGNGQVESGEACDDGNTVGGDGCSADCTASGAATCGNGTVESNEECDDGNTEGGDGCDSACSLEGDCGDGVVSGAEECDDGNTESRDGCTADCREEGGEGCGNGVVEDDEECDDGNVAGGDGCGADCALEPGDCGDGVLNAGEECDDGNTADEDGCDAACDLEGPVCGNGDVEAGEQCDDGNNINFDGCSSSCRDEICGDGVVQPDEQCDDDNTDGGDGCAADCTAEAAMECGNGVLETGEGCDDGNTSSGDGCSSQCDLEQLGVCSPDYALSCGTVDTWNTTYVGSTDDIDLYGCAPWNESGREYAYTFYAPTSSRVTLSLSGTSSDLDVFVISDSLAAQQQTQQGQAGGCSKEACVGYGNTSVTFDAVAGEFYYVVVDGFGGAAGPYSLSVSCGECGDGTIDPGEQCDDGDTSSGDGCSATCTLEACGNGQVDAGESCDDGGHEAGDGCSATCQVEECGNGVVDPGEGCDDGDTSGGDGCDASCQVEGGECSPAYALACGGADSFSTEFVGSTDEIDAYSCASWDESGREYTYQFTAPVSGLVNVSLSDLGGTDLDVFVLGGQCSAQSCIAFGNTTTSFQAIAGQTYYIVVDGYQGASGSYTLEVSCGGGFCGDSVVNAGEQCDDGDTSSGDGCSSSCELEYCGDGVVQSGLGEACDDGGFYGGDGCSSSCQLEAGVCTPAIEAGCNTYDIWSTENAGSTDNVDSYSCVAWNESGREYAYQFTAVTNTTMTVDLSPQEGDDLDVFVLLDEASSNPGVPGCQSDNCIAYGDSSATFQAYAGETFHIVVDGFGGASGGYEIDFLCP